MRPFLSFLLFLSVVDAEFFPGGSFGRSTIGPYNNCSGTLTSRPKDLPVDTLPNISPDAPAGWERWDLSMYQPDLFLSMRWVQGDPASFYSVPAVGTFELVAKFFNGSSYRRYTTGHKLTFTNGSVYSISIDGNTLSWDDTQSWWNITLDVGGVTAAFQSQSIMLDKFSPYAGWLIGQLTKGLFSGIPITRGISRNGHIAFPWGESISLNAESVLNHMFSVEPIQTLVTNYAIRTLRSNINTQFGDAFIYESSRAPNGSQYQAFFLGRAETRGRSFEPYTFYAGTNNDLLSFNQVNRATTHAQLAGCNNTDSIPFSWNYTLPDTGPVAEHVDSAGGKTSFYLVTATTTTPFKGTVYHQAGSGLVQVYVAAGAAMLQNTADAGGEQPPNPYTP